MQVNAQFAAAQRRVVGQAHTNNLLHQSMETVLAAEPVKKALAEAPSQVGVLVDFPHDRFEVFLRGQSLGRVVPKSHDTDPVHHLASAIQAATRLFADSAALAQ